MYQSTKLFLFLLMFGGGMFLIYGCGDGETVVVEKEIPVEDPNGGGGSDKPPSGAGKPISYTQMQGLLNTNCAGCHAAADFMAGEIPLRRSRVLQELNTRNMPPNRGALSDGDRNLMVNFFL